MATTQPPKEAAETTVTVTDDLRSPVTTALLTYWQEKRGEHPYPAWSDFNLMDIYKIASHIVIRDVVDGGREFLCRYSGTGVSTVLGLDATGKLLSESYSPQAVAAILKRYQPALTSDGPVRAVGYVRAVEKNLPTGFEAVYLPLAGNDGKVGHIIAAYDFGYEPDLEEATPP